MVLVKRSQKQNLTYAVNSILCEILGKAKYKDENKINGCQLSVGGREQLTERLVRTC
jgi:hypothetical protein